MNHRPEARIRNKPLAAHSLWEINGLRRTKMDADTAPFAGGRIDLENIVEPINRIESTDLFAATASDAIRWTDHRFVSAFENGFLLHLWLQNQMQIGGIDIAIGKNRILCQRSKRTQHTGFPRSALPANDHYFFHYNTP